MQSQQQVQQGIQMAEVGGFGFVIHSLIGYDLTEYPTESSESPSENRNIEIFLVGPHSHTFVGIEADHFYHWMLQWTGRARIQTATPVGPVGIA